MPRPVHFEIHADDPARAIGFYSMLFAWKFTKWDGPMEYWMVVTGSDSEPGINGGLMRRMGPPATHGQAVNAYVCTSMVADVDASVAQAVKLGGGVALPKMPIPGLGWLAYVKDTEGNILGLMQSDPAAK
jgi:predicted enzyme related to lactoylglutathione lyase